MVMLGVATKARQGSFDAQTASSSLSVPASSPLILFYGDGCPHCAIVEKFITDNGIDKKISIQEKEVYYHQENANQLSQAARGCGLDTGAIGVPFLWDGKICVVGDEPIIDFLKKEVSQ